MYRNKRDIIKKIAGFKSLGIKECALKIANYPSLGFSEGYLVDGIFMKTRTDSMVCIFRIKAKKA